MLADKAGVKRTTLNEWHQWQRQELHTLYLFDVRAASEYDQGHLPGSRHVPGGQLVQETDHYASVRHARIVLIDDDGVRANSTGSWLAQLAQLIGKPVTVLKGRNTAWKAAGLPVVQGETTLLLPRIDRYRRPYEGTDNTPEAMQAYLDWEYGLVAQQDRDGTHGFNVLTA